MIKILTLLLFIYYAIAIKPTSTVECDVKARLDSGWVCGLIRETQFGEKYASFRGVPYAQQPLGKLRFTELQPIKNWPHCLDATEEGPVCPQEDVLYGRLVKPVREMSESCINVNIHVPINAMPNIHDKSETNNFGYPIFVFIHGGGFSYGSGDADLHGPDYLVGKGFIVITFNYRLNVFGFLSLNTTKIPGNAGLRDQLTLLQWVQRNAKAFGGDPHEVTLAGQSAGAVSAHLIALSDHSRGLFKRIILMSGTGVPAFYSPSPIYASEVADKFLKAVGINSTDPDFVHDQLVNMNLDEIMRANSKVLYEVGSGTASFMPVVEAHHPGVTRIVDDDPVKLIKRGRDKKIPIIVGITNNECESFRPRFEEIHFIDRIKKNPTLVLDTRIPYSTTPETACYMADIVIANIFQGTINMNDFMEPCLDTLFKYPAFQLVRWRWNINAAPTFIYEFTYESEHSLLKDALNIQYNGNAHIEDLLYLFYPEAASASSLSLADTRDERMRDWLTTLVVNFMKCNDPSCYQGWPSTNPQELNYQSLYEPGVYNNTYPTPEERDRIQFHDQIHQIARGASTAPDILLK